jgi:hypothetical protein
MTPQQTPARRRDHEANVTKKKVTAGGCQMQKQILVVLVSALAFVNSGDALAQGTSLGVVGGVNIASLSVEDDEGIDLDSRLGLLAGAHLSIDFKPTVGLMLEALYSQKGATATEQGVDVGFNFTYVEFPILAKFMIPTSEAGKVSVHLAAGPVVGLEVGCKVTGEEGGTSVSFDCDEVGADTKSVDFGLMLLGGLDIQVGAGAVLLDIGYTLGLADVNDTTDGNSIKNRSLCFKAGYKFALGSD